MKGLVVITVLVIAIGLPSLTLAFASIDLYTKLWIFSGPLLSLGFLFIWFLCGKLMAKIGDKSEIKTQNVRGTMHGNY
ncbi:MAG: hypothetical protein L0Y68_01745 [Candidatus Dadabacteria bacterium]|nr:hypothetical protein [Candidatus Dadabacteria bacterium]